MHKHENGHSLIELVLIIVVACLVTCVGFYIGHSGKANKSNTLDNSTNTSKQKAAQDSKTSNHSSPYSATAIIPSSNTANSSNASSSNKTSTTQSPNTTTKPSTSTTSHPSSGKLIIDSTYYDKYNGYGRFDIRLENGSINKAWLVDAPSSLYVSCCSFGPTSSWSGTIFQKSNTGAGSGTINIAVSDSWGSVYYGSFNLSWDALVSSPYGY